MPCGKGHGKQSRPFTQPLRNRVEKLLVSEDTRPAKFIGCGTGSARQEGARYGLGHVLYIDGLQPGLAPAKQRVSRESFQEPHKRVEKSVILAEHDGWANDNRIAKGCLHSQFTLTPAADVAGARYGIGADP